MGDQGSSVETKVISLRVPVDLNPADITRLKAKKEDQVDSQEIPFEVEEGQLSRGQKRTASEALGQVPIEDVANAPVSDQDLGQPQPQVNLADIWEWDWVTGDPIFKCSHNPWSRYVPAEFSSDVIIRSGKNSDTGLKEHERRVINCFVEGMRSNNATFQLEMGATGVNGDAEKAEGKLFNRVLYFDIKKFSFTRTSNGDCTKTFVFTKNDDPFLRYADLTQGEKTFTTVVGLSSKGLGELAMKNAKYGYAGPGSFWCRQSPCKLRELMTASAVVDFGGPRRIESTKRFTCTTPNVIYALHCNVCAHGGTYAIHVGSTGTIHERMTNHFDPTRSHTHPNHQIYTPNEINTFIGNGQDPGQFRRDSHVHFGDRKSDDPAEDLPGYEHPGIGRQAARITIIQQFSASDRGKAEQTAKTLYHSQEYLERGRGGLNKYSSH